jgi:hypothetical protein
MAVGTIIENLTKYTDQVSGTEVFHEAVLMATTLNEPNAITVYTDVQYQRQINLITSLPQVQLNSCAASGAILTATGSVTLAGTILAVCDLAFIENICLADLQQYWTGMAGMGGSYDEKLGPAQFAEAYLADKLLKIAAFIDDIIWVGNSSGSGTFSTDVNMTFCNGFLYNLMLSSASASVLTIAGSYSGALVASTAIACVDKLIGLLVGSVSQVLNQPDITAFMNYADFQTLLVAWRQFNGFHIEIGQTQKATVTADSYFMYPGTNILVKATRGLNGTTGKIVLTYAKNLVMGCYSEKDWSSPQVWFEKITNSLWYRNAFKIGAVAVYPQFVVLKDR